MCIIYLLVLAVSLEFVLLLRSIIIISSSSSSSSSSTTNITMTYDVYHYNHVYIAIQLCSYVVITHMSYIMYIL